MNRLRGYLFILGAAVFRGISATAAKYLINASFDTFLLVQMRITLSCLILLPAGVRAPPQPRIHAP